MAKANLEIEIPNILDLCKEWYEFGYKVGFNAGVEKAAQIVKTEITMDKDGIKIKAHEDQ